MRTTSGSWRVAKDFANLPAWIVKAVGGSTTHWAGASLRFDEHEFKVKSTYGGMPGANLLDWPITLAEMEPWYAKAENKMGVTRTNGIPGLPGNNNFKVLEAGAKKLGYKTVHTGNMAINSEPRDGRGSCQQIGFCFQGCKSGAKWSTLYTEIPKGEATGNLEVRPNSMVIKIEHDASGKVTDVVYADETGAVQRQKARVVAVAGMPRSKNRCICTAAPPWPVSSVMRLATSPNADLSVATRWKLCRSACPSWQRSSIRALGDDRSQARWRRILAWQACG
jgi:choline dehydrogenase-like flavoprotein